MIPEEVEIGTGPPHPLADWFDHHRENRAKARVERNLETDRPSRAVLTMARNESFILPIWLRYYSQFFEPEDIYVLDHGSTDGSTEGEGFVRIPIEREKFDHVWQRDVVGAKQKELFETYDTVLYCDADELVVPHPSLGDLGDYIDRLDEPFVNCLGYDMIHMADREPALDPTRPITEQRSYWFWDAFYNKAALAREPIEWVPGFHRREDFEFRPDPDLLMIHLHRVDYQQCLKRHQVRSSTEWSDGDAEESWGSHNHITDEEEFKTWFYTDVGMPGFKFYIEEMPEEWKGAF